MACPSDLPFHEPFAVVYSSNFRLSYNVLVAALLCVAGILAIILEAFEIPLFLVAIYVVIFSGCLMGFELRWKALERV